MPRPCRRHRRCGTPGLSFGTRHEHFKGFILVRLAILTAVGFAASMSIAPPAQALSWAFQSPSGNIACHLSELGAACDIRDFQYAAPPRPQDCSNGWGDRIALGIYSGSASFGCHTTSFLEQLPTQDFDRPLSAGAFRCEVSSDSGVTCRDTTTGHFFQMAQQSYRLG